MAHGGAAYPSGAAAAAASAGGFTARPTGGGAMPTDLNLNRIALEYPYADLAAATENFSPKVLNFGSRKSARWLSGVLEATAMRRGFPATGRAVVSKMGNALAVLNTTDALL
ncbi:hypothetical protein FOZ63_029883, partial [Perkinsus olseni]